MTGHHLLVHDGTFAVVTDCGDITGARGASPDGLFSRDARHVSRWQLALEGSPPELLVAAGQAGPDRPLAAVLTPPGRGHEPPAYTVFREQAVADRSLAERIRLTSNRPVPTTARVTLTVDSDFADQFELRSDHRAYDKTDAVRTAEARPDGVAFGYERPAPGGEPEWHSRTVITAVPAPDAVTHRASGTTRTLEWQVLLPPHGSGEIIVQACALPSGTDGEPPRLQPPATAVAGLAQENASFTAAGPRPRDLISWAELARACEQGLADLAGLRVPATGPEGEPLRVPAAGIPWFLALFGRDSLLTSLFALPYRPELASATLLALAATQGTDYDPPSPFGSGAPRQEQPGRIAHEIRHGELPTFRQVPYGRYYGAVDATPLFLTLLHAYTERTADDALARRLEGQARAAAEWMFRDGGLTDRGWLVYAEGPLSVGGGQSWRDSPGAICFSDGLPAEGPIAVAAAQGYAYDALTRTAALARKTWDDAGFADRLEEAAGELRARFQREFWMTGPSFPALALDGRGRQVDALASDAGHLLWSGILDASYGESVGRRLLEPDFFSGWGIRTLAAGQAPYHPLSWHRGAIWPHDNALTVLGLARYGLTEQALEVIRGLVEAAAVHDWRLPEVMAGYGRDEHPTPVPCPHSCSPQAWAAATPLALLTALTPTQP
ncbi:glycogen debranching N-terminal domain-containing protein [Streptomyces pathocidini]|uniref:Glycogen debranching N-terminal domain-containing protein n=1 Tax=Streptomyces pathocidini TaxID=1650571 RepID=A0ABW7UTX3_9ACTN